jgi:hypothetical protein
MDNPDFDFDTFPATQTLTLVRDLTDPLTATFTDLDLAPARAKLNAPELADLDYWND